ncbi:hypothetical protein [Streptomyces sp. NBC_01187]|uniref:hypothetical protein n=1 Tax=unclassified Streptomyces TaxID=2593676 RepID=UPI003865FA11
MRKISDRSVLVTGGSRGLGLMERGGVDRLAALTAAIDVVRRGGRVSISGVYGGALDPLGVGHFTTHTLSLEEGPNAYGTFQCKEDGMVKTLLKPSGGRVQLQRASSAAQ